MALSDTQKREYEEQGYTVVKNLFTRDELDTYLRRAREIATGDIPEGGEKMIVRDVRVAKGAVDVDDPEKGLWKLLQPDHFDPVFESYPRNPKLLDCIEHIVGPDIKAFLTMMIYKPPHLESPHPYHQDASYFNFGPDDLVCGSWIALDPTRNENGTLTVIPGSHKLGRLSHELLTGELVNFGLLEAEGYSEGHPDEVAVALDPGDGIIFHSRLLHRTGPNTTDSHRRVLTVHFASCKCEFTGELLGQMKMRLVRGHEFAGCI